MVLCARGRAEAEKDQCAGERQRRPRSRAAPEMRFRFGLHIARSFVRTAVTWDPLINRFPTERLGHPGLYRGGVDKLCSLASSVNGGLPRRGNQNQARDGRQSRGNNGSAEEARPYGKKGIAGRPTLRGAGGARFHPRRSKARQAWRRATRVAPTGNGLAWAVAWRVPRKGRVPPHAVGLRSANAPCPYRAMKAPRRCRARGAPRFSVFVLGGTLARFR